MNSKDFIRFKLPSGQYGLIDRENEYLLKEYKWHIGKGYVITEKGSKKNKDRKITLMHRLVIEVKDNEIVDHINRNPLDNRKHNLRVATRSTNGMNRPAQRNNTSGYKGVYYKRDKDRWFSTIDYNGVSRYLGSYKTKEQAYKAYCDGARKYHGEFACV